MNPHRQHRDELGHFTCEQDGQIWPCQSILATAQGVADNTMQTMRQQRIDALSMALYTCGLLPDGKAELVYDDLRDAGWDLERTY